MKTPGKETVLTDTGPQRELSDIETLNLAYHINQQKVK